MREELVGYLLGALDDTERAEVEEHLQNDEALRGDLEALRCCCAVLQEDRAEFDPPAQLAEQTCCMISDQAATPAAVSQSAVASSLPVDSAYAAFTEQTVIPHARWRMVDVAVAAGILVAASLLILPAVNHSRFTARLNQCQDNLREIGVALQRYSQGNNGYFPADKDNRLSAAAIAAPMLLEQGYITDANRFSCAAGEACNFPLPTLEEFAAAHGEDLSRLAGQAGGSYGMTLGHMENGRYVPTRNQGRANFALMSDSPCPMRGWSQSSNHDGLGQNVLYEDGHTDFCTSCTQSDGVDQNFYRNDQKQLAPGMNAGDSVIVHSRQVPRVDGFFDQR